MSIYATCLDFDDEEHETFCDRMVRLAEDQSIPVGRHGLAEGILTEEGSFYIDWERPCTCGDDRRAPIVYQGSHVTPDQVKDRRGGSFGLSTIPPHISPRGISHDEEEETRWDVLRVDVVAPAEPSTTPGMQISTQLLDRDQVVELRDFLTSWLDRGTDW